MGKVHWNSVFVGDCFTGQRRLVAMHSKRVGRFVDEMMD